MYLLNRLWFGSARVTEKMDSSIAQGPDDDTPALGQQFAQFGAGCFWSVELAFQRVAGVTKTEVGYSQGLLHNPRYQDVCSATTRHSEVVRVQYDPKECSYETLLDAFWAKHDPTTLNRQVHIKFVFWSITLILFDYLIELIWFLIYIISICFTVIELWTIQPSHSTDTYRYTYNSSFYILLQDCSTCCFVWIHFKC